MAHQFEVDIAVEYGVHAAVLFQNISFWCEKNRANGQNFFDGNYWTYNSRKAFAKLFPYMSERQIRTALDKLVDDGMLVTGCYNEDKRDRKLWYAVTEKGLCKIQKSPEHLTNLSDARDADVKALADSKPIYLKPDDKHTPRKSAKSVFTDGFDDFWAVYPKRDAKQSAERAWAKLKPNDELKQIIIAGVHRDINGKWKDIERRYIPNPSTYLNQRRWEDETARDAEPEPRPEPEMTIEERRRREEEQSEIDRRREWGDDWYERFSKK